MLTEMIRKLTEQYLPGVNIADLHVTKGYSGKYLVVNSRLFAYSPVDYTFYIQQMIEEFNCNPFGSAFKLSTYSSYSRIGTATTNDISDDSVLSLFWKETSDSGIYTSVFRNVLEIKWIFEMQ